MTTRNFLQRDQHRTTSEGFSLVETLITVAVIGVMAVIWMQYMRGANDLMSDAQTRQKVVGIEHYLLGFSDCKNTSEAPNYSTSCSLNESISIRDKFGNELIPASGRVFGAGANAVKVTGTCQDGTITFSAQLLGQSSKSVPLYDGIPWYCPTSQIARQCIKVKDNLCPGNYAALAFNDGAGSSLNYKHNIECCPVPTDLLLVDHVWSPQHCDTNRVVTGVTGSGSTNRTLRCTKIDTAIYSLAALKTSQFFETSPYRSASGWGTAIRKRLETTTALSIPQKFFLMKKDNLNTDPDYPGTLTIDDTTAPSFFSQCISPNGNGIFTGRSNKYCGTHKTAEIILKATGSIVQLFPTGCTGTFSNKTEFVTMTNTVCTYFPPFWSETPNLRRP